MHLPASLKSCRTPHSPAIRSSLCRSTPQPRTTCRGFACSAFRRDRSKKNSKRCSSKANEETQQKLRPDSEEEMVPTDIRYDGATSELGHSRPDWPVRAMSGTPIATELRTSL